MYQHLLVTTDGSKLSDKAVKAALNLAHTMHARVTALHVILPYAPPLYLAGDGQIPITYDPKHYKKITEKGARHLLTKVEEQARVVGVACTGSFVTHAAPWEAIVKFARRRHCDLIVMASHGRRGLKGFLLGSETRQVLTHSDMPVLVVR